MSDDARRVREALADPHDIAEKLGLLEGAKRQSHGGILIRCPAHNHNERSASCSLTLGPADGTLRVRCFGCGLAGDVFALVAATMGVDPRRDFRAVFIRAAELASVDVSRASRRGGDARPHHPILLRRDPLYLAHDRDAEARAFHAAAVEVLRAHDLVGDHPSNAVRAYLQSRGLLEHAQRDGWGALPGRSSARLRQLDAELAALGVAREDGSIAFADHRLVIPWRDRAGRITAIQRRLVGDGDGPRYTQAGHVLELYGVDRLDAADPNASIVIVEGASDVLAVRALARGPVVALGLAGVASWRPAWAELTRGRRVLVATDADAAGDACADRIASDLAGVAASVERRRPSGAKDWSELLERRGLERAS